MMLLLGVIEVEEEDAELLNATLLRDGCCAFVGGH